VDKSFNITGPCLAEYHYMIPALDRCSELLDLVKRGKYFVLHAPRQTGKTTLIQDLVDQIDRQGEQIAFYCSLEAAQGKHDDAALRVVLSALLESFRNHASTAKLKLPDLDGSADLAILKILRHAGNALAAPLVILFDEVDCLEGAAMISFLRQLRNGYVERGRIPFPHAIGLIGMRNVRDYRAEVRSGRSTLGSASPFNIAHKAITLGNFTRAELGDLYDQHRHATGQAFPDEVVDTIHAQTDGQPWLCNAIAREIVEDLLDNDHDRAITPDLVTSAIENIILRRDTHIDSLLERLKEPRVRKILEPVILGEQSALTFSDDDAAYTFDLGLLRMNDGDVAPANPIYGEVIMRALSYDFQHQLPKSLQGAFISDDHLDMHALLTGFQQFWRENSTIWSERYDYREAAPHLILQAYLQRIVNGGGSIHREYSAGRGRVDLCVTLKEHRYPIELKILRDKRTRDEGIEQLTGYLESLGESEGWLILFDRDPDRSWAEKLSWDCVDQAGKRINLVGW